MLLPTAQRWHKDVAQGPEFQSLCDRPALPRKTKRKSKAPQGMPQTSSTSTSFYDVGAHRGSSPFSCHTLNSGHRQQQCIIRSSGVWCSVRSFAAFGVSRKRSCALHERSACSFDILTAPARVCVPNTKLRRTQSIANQDTELLRKLPVIHAKKKPARSTGRFPRPARSTSRALHNLSALAWPTLEFEASPFRVRALSRVLAWNKRPRLGHSSIFVQRLPKIWPFPAKHGRSRSRDGLTASFLYRYPSDSSRSSKDSHAAQERMVLP